MQWLVAWDVASTVVILCSLMGLAEIRCCMVLISWGWKWSCFLKPAGSSSTQTLTMCLEEGGALGAKPGRGSVVLVAAE